MDYRFHATVGAPYSTLAPFNLVVIRYSDRSSFRVAEWQNYSSDDRPPARLRCPNAGCDDPGMPIYRYLRDLADSGEDSDWWGWACANGCKEGLVVIAAMSAR